MASTKTESHVARVVHRCHWCWQLIQYGERYKRYRWFDSGSAGTVKMHEECYGALEQAIKEEGGSFEWTPGMERPEKVVSGGVDGHA